MLVYQILFKYILNVSKLRHRNSYNINVALFCMETLFTGCSRANEKCIYTYIHIHVFRLLQYYYYLLDSQDVCIYIT